MRGMTLTGTPAAIARAHETLAAIHVLTTDAMARIVDLAALDPDAAETGPLMSASHAVQLAVLTLAGASADLSEACHVAHTRLGQ